MAPKDDQQKPQTSVASDSRLRTLVSSAGDVPSPDDIRDRLSTVMDPELNVDIVSLGLIYDVSVSPKQVEKDSRESTKWLVHIVMTLTTPGCPLAGIFDQLVRDSLHGVHPEIDIEQDVQIELTFDPPWVPDMMSEEARAELGF